MCLGWGSNSVVEFSIREVLGSFSRTIKKSSKSVTLSCELTNISVEYILESPGIDQGTYRN